MASWILRSASLSEKPCNRQVNHNRFSRVARFVTQFCLVPRSFPVTWRVGFPHRWPLNWALTTERRVALPPEADDLHPRISPARVSGLPSKSDNRKAVSRERYRSPAMTQPETILAANIARYRSLIAHETDAGQRARLEEALARDLQTQKKARPRR